MSIRTKDDEAFDEYAKSLKDTPPQPPSQISEAAREAANKERLWNKLPSFHPEGYYVQQLLDQSTAKLTSENNILRTTLAQNFDQYNYSLAAKHDEIEKLTAENKQLGEALQGLVDDHGIELMPDKVREVLGL